jgi:uncharacterized protein (TIGR02453 family)
MASKFPGFSPRALSFFRQLAKNNDRDWFSAHKPLFDVEVRQPMVELVGLMCDEFARFAVDYVPERPEKAIFRIYRDTRFSKDKTPYKTHIAAQFQHRRVPRHRGAALYFEVSHEGLGVAGGMYMPDPEQLLAVRQCLAGRWEQFARLCADRQLVKAIGVLQGESLVRVPKGFDPRSPAADWLRRKQYYFYVELDARLATGPQIYEQVMGRFRRCLPMVQFLNEAVLGAIGEEEEARPVRPEPMF